jgi:5-aminolevulinate synthase
MDSVLRQSQAMCPFMRKATVATLRAMSTSARPSGSRGGGTMSKLQVLAGRCPVMGKAMAIQSARTPGRAAMPFAAGLSTLSGHAKTPKARLHTSRVRDARAVEGSLFKAQDNGKHAVGVGSVGGVRLVGVAIVC